MGVLYVTEPKWPGVEIVAFGNRFIEGHHDTGSNSSK